MPTTVKYYRVVGSRRIADGQVRHFLEEVADAQGTVFTEPGPRNDEIYDAPAAQRQPDDTIVKKTVTHTVTWALNPTT